MGRSCWACRVQPSLRHTQPGWLGISLSKPSRSLRVEPRVSNSNIAVRRSRTRIPGRVRPDGYADKLYPLMLAFSNSGVLRIVEG